MIGTTANLSYNDPVTVCASLVNYRIHVVDTSAANCVSRSNISGAFLTSSLPPIFSPTLLTTALLPNGDLHFCWKESQDTAQYFVKTYIYHSTSPAGPFTKIDSVDVYNTTLFNNYTDVGANANSVVNYYFLTLTAGCDAFNLIETVAAPSDTLATMLLTLNNATVGSAILNWNPVSTPLPPGSSGTYTIYRRIPPAAWTVVGNTAALTYTDPINLCDTLIEYRVEMTNAQTSCINVSSVDQDVFTSLGDIIDNPEPRCLAVQANGDVVMTWQPAADPTSFFAGTEIYSATSPAGPFTLLTTLTTALPATYTHIGANANNQVVYYYLRSLSGCDGTRTNGSTSDTLATMRLTVSNATLGSAILNWNTMHTPALGSVAGPYKVMRRSTGIGAYVQIGTTAALTYTDPITNCNIPYEYRIELDDNLPCTSISSAANAVFSWIGNVVTNPDLRCVSVLPSGAIQLTWLTPTGTNTDFNEFEIYRNSGAGFTLIDSVSTFNLLTYTDNTANGNAQSYSYYLLSQSGCTGQVNSPANSATVNSIFLTTTPALGQANLNWNSMPLLPTAPASGYDVWSSYPNGNSLSIIGSTTSLTYAEPINDCDTTLQHRISVTDGSGCISNSNVDVNTFTYIGNIVPNPDLRCVNVLPSGAIQLTWVSPSGASTDFNEYEIYRNSGAGFTLVDSVGTFNQLTFTDNAANGNAQSYSYYLLSQSGCSGQVNSPANSATVSSIYLTTTPSLGQATLNWNAMPLLPSSPASGYDVWSSYPNGNSLSIIGTTGNLTYTEPINDCDTTLQHRISVTDASGCVSNSNVDINTFTYIGNIIPHPELRCASVLPNGQVQLTWVNPSPASWINFNQYNLYRNSGAGFVLLDSIENNAISTFTDALVNANASSIQYYLQTKSGCSGQIDPSATGGAVNGNTLQTIFLNLSGGNTTTAVLNWNAVSAPLLPTSTAVYTIERKQPANSGTWTIAASNVAATTWQENLVLCIDSVRYRVSIADAAGCTSLSNVDTDEFVDHTIPDAPSPRCVSVQPNGQVTVNWIAPADTGQRFGMYTLYRGNSPGGPFLPVTTINNYNTLSTIDNTVNAQAASYSYVITTKTACGGEESLNSDTLQTIKVNVANNNGVAIITWNPIHNPELTTATQSYRVLKEYPAGIWNQIGTTIAPVYQWTDTINLCEAIINYRVETGDQSGCTSVSSTDGDLFRDVTRPTVSSLDSVSLDPFNPANVSVSWLPSPSGDVVGYIVYQFNGASWDSIGAIQGINGSYFLHNNPAAEFASQRYSIAAYDSCGNVSNIGVSHNTLFSTGKLDVCRGAIDLRWNPYINMVNGIAQYQIFMSENGGSYNLLATVPGSNVSYSHTGLNDETNYCYYIQAVGNTTTRTSRSNIVCVYADLLELPTFSYLKRATVLDSRRVLVECWVDVANNPDVSRYKLQRAFDPNGPYVTVNAATYTGLPLVTFIDNGAKTNQYSYYYRVITIDSCGNEVLISNLGRTILLTGQPEFNLVNELSWNFYEDWLGGVGNYALFRSVDGVWDPAPLATLNDGVLEYNDDVSALYKFPTYKGKFCYRIEAYEGPGNTYGFTDTSVSNEFCLIQEPHVFVPNGFTPGGKNSVFRPEFIYVDIKNYYFAVLNRWGQKVYETRTPGEGWDGTYNGSIAPEGTYAYTIRIFGTNGQEIEKIGTVTLLR
ncbi:MAG: gliding motility-associated C-terminal domain-containing protein [Bacteroidota bacterium]